MSKKKQTEIKTTAKQRRAKFNPRKWASKWLRGNPMGIRVVVPSEEAQKEFWKDAIVCADCGGTFGGGIIKGDDKVYCHGCDWKHCDSCGKEAETFSVNVDIKDGLPVKENWCDECIEIEESQGKKDEKSS